MKPIDNPNSLLIISFLDSKHALMAIKIIHFLDNAFERYKLIAKEIMLRYVLKYWLIASYFPFIILEAQGL